MNRYLHIGFQSANADVSKCQNGTLNCTLEELEVNSTERTIKRRTAQSANSEISKCKNCTLEELAILNLIANNPSITQKEIAEKTGKSERTIKSKTITMQEKGLIQRVNGKRNGKWEILVEL